MARGWSSRCETGATMRKFLRPLDKQGASCTSWSRCLQRASFSVYSLWLADSSLSSAVARCEPWFGRCLSACVGSPWAAAGELSSRRRRRSDKTLSTCAGRAAAGGLKGCNSGGAALLCLLCVCGVCCGGKLTVPGCDTAEVCRSPRAKKRVAKRAASAPRPAKRAASVPTIEEWRVPLEAAYNNVHSRLPGCIREHESGA